MSPIDALWEAILAGSLFERHQAFQVPGAIVNRMKEESREALRALTSADAIKVRFEPWMVMGSVYEADRRRRELLLDFDRLLRRS